MSIWSVKCTKPSKDKWALSITQWCAINVPEEYACNIVQADRPPIMTDAQPGDSWLHKDGNRKPVFYALKGLTSGWGNGQRLNFPYDALRMRTVRKKYLIEREDWLKRGGR